MKKVIPRLMIVAIAGFFLAGWMAAAAPQNSLFNPKNYPILAESLNVSTGTVTIDTKDGTNAPTMTIPGPTVYNGQIVTNQSGQVVMALFNLGSVTIGSGAAVDVLTNGNLGLVLACKGDMNVAATIDLSGRNGYPFDIDSDGDPNDDAGDAASGVGGPGAEGGLRGSQFKSNPPGNNRGRGGNPAGDTTGIGYGAGAHGGGTGGAGCGGGYGGRGGTDGAGSTNYGIAYGDSVLTNLYGGSGAAAAWCGGAGGGGGALELVANGDITLSGTIKVNGGNAGGGSQWRSGGGGSGGGVILAAHSLTFSGRIEAKGGIAGNGANPAGCGGGGRVAFYCCHPFASAPANVSVIGGSGGSTGPGAEGTFRYNGDGFPGDLSFPFLNHGTVVYLR